MKTVEDILKEHPLTFEHENDARHVWPERWSEACKLIGALRFQVEKLREDESRPGHITVNDHKEIK